MIALAGADLVLPDRVLDGGAIVIEGDRLVEIVPSSARRWPPGTLDLAHHVVVPGFIDVHVHGVHGVDALDGPDAIRTIAARLPRYGVTAFCPTSIACAPAPLRRMLEAVRTARTSPDWTGARVLPAHLESNFINPEFKGAQPLECLRLPTDARPHDGDFTGAEIVAEIAAARPDVGIVTIAPELPGALDLVRTLAAAGHHVSLGHSGAAYDEAIAAIDEGARQATHLFNRMTPINHRLPGLAGAVLEREDVVAELVCDGVHVHPAMVRVALSAKRPAGIMAITDGTAGSGLLPGARTTLGGRPITVRDAAYLDDGTLAGSVLTMDAAFARLVTSMGLSLVDAATVCATTPARALGLTGHGVIAPGAVADLTVLNRELQVTHTFVAGRLVYSSAGAFPNKSRLR